jgi:hypothetical protein
MAGELFRQCKFRSNWIQILKLVYVRTCLCMSSRTLMSFFAERWIPIPGLPDGLFSNQNPNLGKFWMALDWKVFQYFMAIWNILWRFGIFYDHLYYSHSFGTFFRFLMSCTKKNLATLERACNVLCSDWRCDGDRHIKFHFFKHLHAYLGTLHMHFQTRAKN